jgi:putative protease
VRLEAGDSLRFHRSDDSRRLAHKLEAAEPAGAPGRDWETGKRDTGDGERDAGGGAGDPGRALDGAGEQDTGSDSAERDAGDDAGLRGWWISLPDGFEPGDSVYLIQSRGMSKRYPPVVPRNLDAYGRCPGRDRAPVLTLSPAKRREALRFPEGIYAVVSRPEDLFVLQSVRPVRVMLACNRRTLAWFLGKEGAGLPFRPGEIIIVLDPYFPEAMDAPLGEEITRLRALGYSQFVVNNPGQFSYFRDLAPAASLIAGPYLYTYNRRALAFVASLGTDYVVSPPENNRRNLERTLEPGRRAFAFITVFSYPPLFRIRGDLGELYDFRDFQDSRGERFRLLCGEADGSLVIPERPFSIVDKIPFLERAGFGRFIVDLSGPPLRKKDYKDIMGAISSASPLPDVSRFNWKDGFYSDEKGKSPGLSPREEAKET